MTYAIVNATSAVDIAIYASTVTGGLFWPLILMAIWIVSFGTFIGFSTPERSLVGASWLTAILGAILYAMQAMDGLYAVIFIGLALATFVMLLFSKQ